MAAWIPRSQRMGEANYDGPFYGMPEHLKLHVVKWVQERLERSSNPREYAISIALRLNITVNPALQNPSSELIRQSLGDPNLMWDVVEGALRATMLFPHEEEKLRSDLNDILNLSGSAYTVTEDLYVIEKAGEQAQELYESVVDPDDSISAQLREAWVKAYGRSPDPSDAWDHAIKALETVLKPIVSPKNEKTTLGSIISNMRQTPDKFMSAYLGPQKDHSVAPLIEVLTLIWPNPDRHGDEQEPQIPSLGEARAVVNLVVALIQCHRDEFLIQLRE